MANDGNTGQGYDAGKTSYGDSSVQDLDNLYRKARSVRERFVPEWSMNTAFYLGHQWMWWNRGRLDLPNLASWRQTPVDNRILPVVWARAARKVKNRPSFQATPFTGDESDIEAAELGEKVLDADWVNLDLQAKLFQAILFSEICGAGFWKVYWDGTKGDSAEFVYLPDGSPMTQQDGRPTKAEMYQGGVPEGLNTKEVATGDICVDVLSPFEMFPDPLATSLDECEWMIEEKVRSVEYVKKRYNVELKPDTAAPTGAAENRMFPSTYYAGQGSSEEYKGIRLRECWYRPSTEHPKGKRCVWGSDRILAEEEPFDPNPYIMFSGVRAPNRFWPTSITTQLRSPQIQLNKIKAQIQENAMRVGNPAIMKSRHANVKYTGLPGEEILYDSTVTDAAPSYLVPPEVPMYVREEIMRVTESIAEISGVHEVSNATVPTGVTAASAINLLQEADDTRLGPEIQDMEYSLGHAGTKVLKLRANFNTDERLIRIAGEDGNWDIFGFRGSMLGDNTNVEVQAGSAMPRSKAAKQAAMTEILGLIFQYQVDVDQRSLRRFLKDYEVGALENLFDNISSTEMEVQRENRQMSQGIAVPINDWDEDEDHVAGHDEFRRTGRFQRLPGAVQHIINTHVLAHQERMVKRVNMQIATQAREQQNQMVDEAAMQQANGAQQGAQQKQSAK